MAQSPINPIENLWQDLKMAFHRRCPSNLTALELFSQREFGVELVLSLLLFCFCFFVFIGGTMYINKHCCKCIRFSHMLIFIYSHCPNLKSRYLAVENYPQKTCNCQKLKVQKRIGWGGLNTKNFIFFPLHSYGLLCVYHIKYIRLWM